MAKRPGLTKRDWWNTEGVARSRGFTARLNHYRTTFDGLADSCERLLHMNAQMLRDGVRKHDVDVVEHEARRWLARAGRRTAVKPDGGNER